MKKQPDITDATRDAFIYAFIRLYNQKPIDSITVKELASTAGYNRTTFYNYFTDIQSLYSFMEDFIFSQLKERLIRNLKRIDFEQEFIRTFKEIYEQWQPYLTVLLDDPYGARFTKRMKSEVFNTLTRSLQLPRDNVKTDYLIEFYLSAVLSVISHWLKNQSDMPTEEMAALLREMLTTGILPLINKHRVND